MYALLATSMALTRPALRQPSLRQPACMAAARSRRLSACAAAGEPAEAAPPAPPDSRSLHGWDFWRSIGSPRYVGAPMVDASELPFRLLCASLGTELTYTPMLHARLFASVPEYRAMHFDPPPAGVGRPCIAQLAGHDPAVVLEAARLVEPYVDAVDLNFGCPQGIARKGRYGAFLLEEPEVAVALVETLSRELSVPVTVKMRLLPEVPLEESMALCERFEAAGASALTLHGRTRAQNKQFCGAADWDAVREAVRRLGIPVISNGGIASFGDVEACLAHTGAAAVMSSEALLENPALFCSNVDPAGGAYLDQHELARRYLRYAETHPPTKGMAMARGHLFKFLHAGLAEHVELRNGLLATKTLADLHAIVDGLEAAGWEQPAFHTAQSRPVASWYRRHREVAAAHERAAAAPPESRAEAEAAALSRRADKKAAKRVRRARSREGRQARLAGSWAGQTEF